MEHGKLGIFLDLIPLFRAQLNTLFLQQHQLCWESIDRMVALADLPVPVSSVKRRKGSTRYFQINEAGEQCGNVGEKENTLAGGTFIGRDPQSKFSTKASAKSSRRRKPLVDSQVVNQSHQLDTSSSICTRVADGIQLDEAVAFQQQQRGNKGIARSVEGNSREDEKLFHSEEGRKRGNKGNKCMPLAATDNAEVIHSSEGKRSRSTSVGPLHTIVAGEVREAEESLAHLEKPRSASSVSIGERPSQVKTEAAPDLDAPRLTRNRARMLQNAGGNVTLARGEPPLKKRRGRKGNANSNDSPAAADDETAGKMPTTIARVALDQQSRDEPPCKQPPAVNKKNRRASSRSPAETNGEVGINRETGEEQDMEVVKTDNRPKKTSRTAKKDEEDKAEGRPSKKSRTMLGSTRLNSCSGAESNALDLDKVENARADAHGSGEDHNCKEGSANKPSLETNGNVRFTVRPPSIEIDGIVGKVETVTTNQNEGIHPTAAANQLGNTLHPLDERNGTESPEVSMITLSPENGNTAELGITCSSASEVDLADNGLLNLVRADGGLVRDCMDLPSDCLASAEDESFLQQGAYRCSRRTTLLLSPLLEFAEREANVIVLDHQEFKDEHTISISEVVAMKKMEENPPQPLTEARPTGLSCPLAETHENSSRSPKVVAHSVLEHSPAAELDVKESKMDAIGDERTDLQLPAICVGREWVGETKDGMPVLEVSISFPDRDGDGVDREGLHSIPGIALQLHESVNISESSNLLGQPPQTPITHRNRVGTPARSERRLTELVAKPELQGEELVGEERDAVEREKRLTLLLTTPEVRGDALVDVEAGAVRCSQLKISKETHPLETPAIRDSQGGPNSQTTTDVSHQDNRWEGELKGIIPRAADMGPSVGQESRKETTESVENLQPNVSRVIPSVRNRDSSNLRAIGENKSLVSFLSSLGRASPASVNDNHRAGNVMVQRNTDPSCKIRDGSKEVGTTVTPLEQSSEPSKPFGCYHMEGIGPTDYAPPYANAQYSSDMRLSRLLPTKQVGRSWVVADSGEGDNSQSQIMIPNHAHEGSGTGNEIEEKTKPQSTTKLDLVDSGAKKTMPFSIDESSVSVQNKKATDPLLELWKKGGMQGSGLASHDGPSCSEPAGRSCKLDVFDEVYRSVVIRECGGDGAVSSFTLPIANRSSGIVCNNTAASSQFGPRVMERSLSVSHRLEVQEVAEVDSLEDSNPDQEKKTIKPSLLLIKDQDLDQSTQDPVSALANSGVVEGSQEIDNSCEMSSESDSRVSEQLLSHEDANMSKPIPLSRVVVDPTVSSVLYNPEDIAVPVVDPFCNADGPVDTRKQVAISNTVNAQKPFSNLIAGMKSFVPVVQQPPPSFIPDGKRSVKVKALVAAEAVKRAEEEKRDVKERLRKFMRKAEDNASSGREKKEAAEAIIQLKESAEGSKFDGGESSCGSQLSPRKQLSIRSNSRNLFSPEAKSKQGTNSEIEKKVKKNQAELKRTEEERKRNLLASRQIKEQLVQKKMEQRQESWKQKREQKLVAEQEDKAQRYQVSGEAEREKMAMEEKIKSKQCTPRKVGREKENLQVEELKVKCAGQGILQTGQARPGRTPGRVRSNLLRVGTLSSRSAVRVPVVSKDKQTAAMVAAAIQKKGRHPSSSSSSSKLLSLNAEPARLPSFNTESARLPSLNAEPARLSSLNVQCAAEGGPRNSTHAFTLGNRPAEVQQGRTGDNVSCSGTPCSGAVDKEEDLGPMTYELTPYRGSSDDESEDEREQPTKPAKHIPFWARNKNLEPNLLKQVTMDPDEIFYGRKTCSLKEVFGKTGSQKIQDFGKRSGSGDWFKDRVSWKEELQYKIDMGYVQKNVPSSFS